MCTTDLIISNSLFTKSLYFQKELRFVLIPISGHICEKNNPCVNGATCGYTRGGYICKCPVGWQGANCDEGKLTVYFCRTNLVG